MVRRWGLVLMLAFLAAYLEMALGYSSGWWSFAFWAGALMYVLGDPDG